MNEEFYNMIFKRKSFHLFRNTGDAVLSEKAIENIKEKYKTLTPLCPDIKTAIKIVPASETNCNRSEQYCILLYSEKKDNYLQNIGYIGEQLDLFLVSENIGTLWFGIGKTDEPSFNGLDFVIMIAISKVDNAQKFRKDMFKTKRKPIEEIWEGEHIEGVTSIVGFAPSACNTQPWIVENNNGELSVYRYKKAGKRGIMPLNKVSFYNQIDIGIFMCFLDLCLEHNNITFERKLFADSGGEKEKTLAAKYRLKN